MRSLCQLSAPRIQIASFGVFVDLTFFCLAAAAPALTEDERQRKETQFLSMTTPVFLRSAQCGDAAVQRSGTAHPAEGQNLLPQRFEVVSKSAGLAGGRTGGPTFLFGPCTARFSFEKEKWGVQRNWRNVVIP